eukprot:776872-Pleurochrysis_carterae.AAC.2
MSTTAWALLAITATLAAFAAGRSHVLEGSDGLHWPGIGFDTCGRHQYGAPLRLWRYKSLRVSTVRASRL